MFPTGGDVRIMRDSPDMMLGSLGMFGLPRNVAPALLACAVAALLARSWPRNDGPRVGRWIGALSLSAVAFGGALAATSLAAGPAGPVDLFTPRMLGEAAACATGPCEPRIQITRVEATPEVVDRGAALLGWPPRDVACPRHPFSRAFPSREVRARSTAAASPVLAALTELSSELFDADERPVHVWQIALEGMRGDDLHALHGAAPRELAPFLTGLHEEAAGGAPHVLAARGMFTAGVRTPHGLAAFSCGLGTLPFGLGMPRDLPDLPVRCLQDVLHDAGFDVGHAYGGALSFDRVGSFLEAHRSRAWVTAETLPAGTARGAWGATDQAVYAAAVRAARPDRSTFGLVLTLSHHHPFTEPEDLTEDARARGAAALRHAGPGADDGDARRLVTYAYADEALRGLFETLRSAGLLERSIVSIGADHAIPDRPLWGRSEGWSPLQQRAQIPWVLWIAPDLLDGARSPARARSLSREAQRALDQVPLSQNDVPTLLLALLERSAPLRGLGAEAAWHTLGGQATSPWYASPHGASVSVHGIDAATTLYFADERGLAAAPEEPAWLVVSERLGRAVTPSLRPAAAPLRLLLGERSPCAP